MHCSAQHQLASSRLAAVKTCHPTFDALLTAAKTKMHARETLLTMIRTRPSPSWPISPLAPPSKVTLE